MSTLLQLLTDHVWEILIGVILAIIQLYYFSKTKRRIKSLAGIFPWNTYSRTNTPLKEEESVLIIDPPTNVSHEYANIIGGVNDYLKSSNGSADYEILRSTVEKDLEVMDDDIGSQINVPLYIGLMGTFLGVGYGLIRMVGSKTINEENITYFMGGVVIAMFISLLGLLLTVINNAGNYKIGKKSCDQRKNAFLKFLQIELWPSSSKGMAEVVNTFRNNIDNFNTKFAANVQLFDEKLSGNIQALAGSVTLIATNISTITKNTESNHEILKELRSGHFTELIKTNLQFTKTIGDFLPQIEGMVQKIQGLNDAMDKSMQVARTVDGVMNRLKGFEEGLNKLGNNLDSAEYMGSDLLLKVNKQLAELDQRFTLLKQYSQTTSGQIEALLAEEKKEVEKLCQKIRLELQNALDFNLKGLPFDKLHLLESIDKSMLSTLSSLESLEELPFQKLALLEPINNSLSDSRAELRDIKNLKERAVNVYPEYRKEGVNENGYNNGSRNGNGHGRSHKIKSRRRHKSNDHSPGRWSAMGTRVSNWFYSLTKKRGE